MSHEQSSNSEPNHNISVGTWDTLQSLKETIANIQDEIIAAERTGDASKVTSLQALRGALTKAFNKLELVPDSPALEISIRDLLTNYWQHVQRRKQTATTGIADLDGALSGGIESQRLVVVLGAPNTGKTTFTHQMADHIANSGRPVLYVTSEDTPGALLAKTIARIGGVPYTAVLKGWSSHEEAINHALAKQLDHESTDRLLYLDATSGITLDAIKEKAASHFARYNVEHGGGPGVIVIDYLQRIARAIKITSASSQELREVITMVTERLRAMAMELDCGMIAIAAQNRSNYNRSSDNGAMASAKESGDIEYTADVMIALVEDKQRGAVSPGFIPVTLYIDKNRQGQKGAAILLDFCPDLQQFTTVFSDDSVQVRGRR